MVPWRKPAIAVLAAAAMAMTGCAGSGATSSAAGEPAFSDAVAPVAGCGAQAHTDPADRSAGKPTARCASGAPAPQPLQKRMTLKVSAQSKGEYFAPVLLGMAMGEFAKENLDIELQVVSFSDALPQLASGALDVALGGPYASVVNAANSGFAVNWVLGNYRPPHGGDVSTPQSGLWFRRDAFTDPSNATMAGLASRTPSIASTQGSGTPAALWLDRAFEQGGLDYGAIKFQSLSPADQVVALRTGAVDGAFLVDPFWREVADDPGFALLAVQPREVNGGAVFGQSLLGPRAEEGLAFTRAYIRTINTYLAGDYKSDPAVVTALAQQIGVGEDIVRRGEPLDFDWEVPAGLYTDLQQLYIRFATVPGLTTPLPEDRLVSREFYDRAVGHVAAS